jgi:hypothetical protein
MFLPSVVKAGAFNGFSIGYADRYALRNRRGLAGGQKSAAMTPV